MITDLSMSAYLRLPFRKIIPIAMNQLSSKNAWKSTSITVLK